MTFTAFPPGYPEVKQVNAGSWAEGAGIQQGYIVFEVNGLDLIEMSKEDFIAQLKIRPLMMYVEPPTPPPSEDGAAQLRKSRKSMFRKSLAPAGQGLDVADPDGVARKRPSRHSVLRHSLSKKKYIEEGIGLLRSSLSRNSKVSQASIESEIGFEVKADEDDASLGMTFTAFPPGYPEVKQVSAGSI